MNYFHLILNNKNVFKTNWKNLDDSYTSVSEKFQ